MANAYKEASPVSESTEVQPRERETHETLKLTDAQYEMLTPRARQLIREHGFGGLRQTSALIRESTSLERNLHFQAVYAEKNAQREMGIVTVDSESTIVEDDESAHLSEEIARLSAERDDLREKADRQARRIEDLQTRLAETAMAVNAKPTQR